LTTGAILELLEGYESVGFLSTFNEGLLEVTSDEDVFAALLMFELDDLFPYSSFWIGNSKLKPPKTPQKYNFYFNF